MRQNFSFAVKEEESTRMVCVLAEYQDDAMQFLVFKYPLNKVVFLGVSYGTHHYEI